MSDPLITVVTPFYNIGPFLAEAIESVLAQSYRNWELVLVDDGSTDEGTTIALTYCKRYPRHIHYAKHPGHVNLGASASRNLGRNQGAGEYISYLDGDDVWLPNKLEMQVRLLWENPDAKMLLGATRYWYSWTAHPEASQQDHVVFAGAPQNRLFAPPELVHVLYPLGRGVAPSINTVLVAAQLHDKVGGWEDDFRKAYEDQVFLTKIYLEAPVYISDQVCDLYRQKRPMSAMQTEHVGSRKRLHRLHYLEWLENYMSCKGLEGSPEWRLLQQALRPYRKPFSSYLERAGLRLLNRLERT
jgi:glycosyltransferase involved in cell wall biosynthesis